MSEYVIIAILQEDAPVNFHKSQWPLHVTIIRPFSSLKNNNDFTEALSGICSARKEITLTGKSYEMFGEDNDVPVTELSINLEIQTLYDEIMRECGSWMSFKMPAYDKYRPHVANQGNSKISVGEAVVIKSISLVELIGEDRKIVGTVMLG